MRIFIIPSLRIRLRNEAGAYNGVFPVFITDFINGRIQAGKALKFVMVKKVILLIAFIGCFAGGNTKQADR